MEVREHDRRSRKVDFAEIFGELGYGVVVRRCLIALEDARRQSALAPVAAFEDVQIHVASLLPRS